MTDNLQSFALISAGMIALRDTLGIVNAEKFLTSMKNPGLDYTKWRENLWEDLTLNELLDRAVKAEEKYGVPDGVQII